MSRWSTLRAWVKRVDDAVLKPGWRPEGIELASPEARQQILATAFLRQRWTRPPVVAPAADWVSQPEAADLLKSRAAPLPHVGLLTARGLIQAAYRATDGADGVTRSSVDEELRWRKEAGLWRRIRRRIGGILHWL